MTEMGRATSSAGIKNYLIIPERNKVRFRNDWQRFRAFLSRVPELKRIESNQNHPQHETLKALNLSLSEERIDEFKAVFEFQDMLVKHINHFESNSTFHVSYSTFDY